MLLHDALYPDQLVREDTGRSETKRQWQMPRATQPFIQAMKEQAAAKEAAAAEKVAEGMAAAKLGEDPNSQFFGQAGAGASVHQSPEVVEVEMEEEGASPAAKGHPAAAGSSTAAAVTTAWQPAGDRALRLLPCCYLLLESVIEVLAEDFAMQEDEMMVIDEAGESEEDEEGGSGGDGPPLSGGTAGRGSGGAWPPRQGQQLLQPGVSQKAAQQLMYSLESTVAVVLQFMDELQEQGGGGAAVAGMAAAAVAADAAGGRWPAVQADLALGAVRLLGRWVDEDARGWAGVPCPGRAISTPRCPLCPTVTPPLLSFLAGSWRRRPMPILTGSGRRCRLCSGSGPSPPAARGQAVRIPPGA